jgi:hypothetical protein
MILWFFRKLVSMKKREFLIGVLFLIPVALLAQRAAPTNQNDSLLDKNEFHPTRRIVTFPQMDQRKIYNWADGQRGTPTGREAGEHVPKWVELIGSDSAMVVQGPPRRYH